MKRVVKIVTMLVMVGVPATVSAQVSIAAPRYISGDLPQVPVLSVSGGEVFLEAVVGTDGRVASTRALRTTPPFTQAVLDAVRDWIFVPAARPTPVFIAAMFAPPSLGGPTLGQPPQDIQPASGAAPMPIAAPPAGYPPRAMGSGIVLVDATLDDAGVVTDARIIVPSPAFDAAALGAARAWSFRPPQAGGHAVTSHAYLMFAFQQPVIGR